MGLLDDFNNDRQNYNSHENGFEDEKEELLNSFLSQVKSPQSQTPDQQSEDPFNHNFPALPTNKVLDKKIHELQLLSKNIDHQCVQEVPEEFLSKLGHLKIDYQRVLNPQQLAAVVLTESPLLVIAGAGSGKTRVIVHRVSYLIERGIDPSSILLLTFTRKAAQEMLNRVKILLKDEKVSKVTGGTFHSFAANTLRRYANVLGIPSDFTILDTSDSEDIIDLIRTELKLNKQDKKFPKKSRLFELISYSRNRGKTIPKIIEEHYTGLKDYIEDVELIYKGYTKYKVHSHNLDFDDLMEVLRDGLRDHALFRKKVQERFQYIMVDEFQDTNIVQKEIVDFIGMSHKRIMVVGDDSQSIYAFRGANYENILRFPQTYPTCKIIKIEQNYRSNQNVLKFTNTIIRNAKIGFKKELTSQITSSKSPYVKQVFDQEEEAEFIVGQILEMRENNIPLSQIAVLNRADWHNRYIQVELNKRGIPYVVVGGFKFNERMHIKDIISYLRIIYNPYDAVSWHRILKYIGGVGRITASQVVQNIHTSDDPYSFVAFRQKKFYEDLIVLANMLRKAKEPENSLTTQIQFIKEYYYPLLKAREDDYEDRIRDVDILIDLSQKYTKLDRFLSDFTLDPPSKRIADQSTPLIDEGEESGKVTISTVHSAKGLEWYAVFIPHALDGLFPSNRAKNIEEMEEERRLFYVACSRAKEELYLTIPRNVSSFDAFFHIPSRFIIEVKRNASLNLD